MNLIIKMTNACNFACSYCSVGAPYQITNLNIDFIKKFFDGCQELMEYKNDNTLTIIWHGGEPLLRDIAVYRELQDYAKDKLKGIDVRFSIQTNGGLIDNDWIQFFKEYDITPGISLDGYKELHNANRLDKLGNTTFDKVMEGITLLKNNGITPGLLMVLDTHNSVDVDRLYNFIVDNGCPIKIHSIFPAGRASEREDLNLLYSKYVDVLIALFKKSMRDENNVIINPLSSLLNSIINECSAVECSYSGTCGKNFMCLHENGEVSFCGRNDSTRVFMYGSIENSTPLELYLSAHGQMMRNRIEAIRQSSCGECDYFHLCHGGCPFEAYLYSENIEDKYKYCNEWKRLLDFIYNEGLDLFREYLVKRKKEINIHIEEKEAMLKECINYV